jgi:hypothetical protein
MQSCNTGVHMLTGLPLVECCMVQTLLRNLEVVHDELLIMALESLIDHARHLHVSME